MLYLCIVFQSILIKMKIFNKKNSIWLIISLMIVTFTALISLQFSYVVRTREIISKQYADAIQRSLYRTVKSVEEAEVLTYIDESFKNDTPEARKAKEAIKRARSEDIQNIIEQHIDSIITNNKNILNSNQPNTSISAAAQKYNEKQYKRFIQVKSLMEIVTAKLLNDSHSRDITTRIDPYYLRDQLTYTSSKMASLANSILPYPTKTTKPYTDSTKKHSISHRNIASNNNYSLPTKRQKIHTTYTYFSLPKTANLSQTSKYYTLLSP